MATAEEFVTKMERLVKGQITRDFLTHGGRFWLPYTFWDCSPDGDAILEFSWITEVRCLQHGATEKPKKWGASRKKTEDQEGSPWDTKPSLPSDMLDRVRKEAGAAMTRPVRNAASPPSSKTKPAAQAGPQISQDRQSHRGVFPRKLLAPLMMLLFFLLLSLSYLVLRYHKNRQVVSRPPPEDVTHERSVLP